MPNIDPTAKAWELDLAERFGKAVQTRRNALALTAQQLAKRTAELGYPVTRVAISKIEGNMRAGKIDVAELIVLAKALDVPPVLLLYPGFPDGYDFTVDEKWGPGEPMTVTFAADVEALPGNTMSSREAVLRFSGRLPSMWIPGGKRLDEVEQNDGANLIQEDAWCAQQTDELHALRRELDRMLSDDADPQAIDRMRQQIKMTEHARARGEQAMALNQAEVWGVRREQNERAKQSLRARGVKG